MFFNVLQRRQKHEKRARQLTTNNLTKRILLFFFKLISSPKPEDYRTRNENKPSQWSKVEKEMHEYM
ncbi:hypothetical protein C2G38_2091193, partial [Gigaspora rosea]